VKAFLSLLLVFGLLLASPVTAGPNAYEMRIIRKDILKAYNQLTDMWKEELYFDMYELGQRASRIKLSKGEFAQRMVDLAWKPSNQIEEIKDVKILYRNYATVHVRMQFENKVNPTRVLLKDVIFTAILEGKGWAFDLTKLIRTPYDGKFVDLAAEKKNAELTSQRAEAARLQKIQDEKAAWEQRQRDFKAGKAQPTPEEEERMKLEAEAAEKALAPDASGDASGDNAAKDTTKPAPTPPPAANP